MVRRASQQRTRRTRCVLRQRAIAGAAATLLSLAGLSVQALPFYVVSGSVNSDPTNFFPIDVNAAVQDFLGSTLNVGNGAAGSFSALAGAQLSLAGLAVANGGGNGTVVFDGAQVYVGGTGNRLTMGNSASTGSLEVRAGALLDATVNANDCTAPGAFCNNFIGHAAGSNVTLAINGAGSEVRTLRSFVLGGAAVHGAGFGLPGGTTQAALNITAGGTLRTDGGQISAGPGGSTPTGNEHTFSSVVIDGVGSRWIVAPDRFGSGGAWLDVALHANAQATINLSNGGQWIVDGNGQGAGFDLGRGGQATLNINSGGKLQVTGGTNPQQTGVRIGRDSGSVAVTTVSGAGSELSVSGHVANVDVGNGAGATGTLNVLNLGRVVSGGLNIGVNGGHGTVMVDGATVEINNGFYGRVLVGTAGNGMLTVANGGLVDATLNPGACVGVWCGNLVGYRAGATGTLTVTGAGSELRTLRNFNVADVWVDQFGGTPGANTTGTINVLAGGTLRTQGATLGSGAGGPLALGTEQSFASVLIDGTGSQWIVTRNTVDNGTAFMNMATHVNATATTTVSGGGLLRIDGGGSIGPYDGLGIGTAGHATLTVTGSGSKLEVLGANPYINVGASNATGVGTLSIENGASATSLFLNVGRNGGTGTLLVTGLGSQLTLSGVGVPFVNNNVSNFPASMIVGWNGSTGHATVSNGGQVLITDAGGDGRASTGSPTLFVGRDLGSQGSLAITGAGSKVEILSTSLGLPAGTADNYNPYMSVGGRDANTSGQLTITNGGVLQLTGHALSTSSFFRGTNFYVGGNSDTLLGGTGTVSISGVGSALRVEGVDAFVGVGVNGTGTMTLSDHALLSTGVINVGRAASGVGALLVDNSQISLNGQQTGNTAVGAVMTIGNRGGNGAVTFANGSLMTITNLGSAGASVNIGGTGLNPLGHGQLTLTGGSQILVNAAPGLATFSVGLDGTAFASLSGASLVDIGTGVTHVGRLSGGSGTLGLSGGSKLMAGQVNIGGSSDTVAGGLGTATVSGIGSELSASGASGFIGVGRRGIGTLSVANQGKVAAITMSVGRSAGGVGTLSVNNATLEFAGQQTSGNFVGAGLAIGTGGGSGSATFANGSLVSMNNPGSAGAYLVVGGSTNYPLGSGTLNVSGGSQVHLTAAPGLARVRIGHDGTGIASFSGASLLDAGDGDVIIAGEPGSTGLLTLNTGSVLNAGYVGVGSKPGSINGGVGTLIVNDSIVNATTVEIGSLSLLAGNGGRINGHVINRGTVGPGNSPGRLIVDGRFDNTDQGKIVLDVEDDGVGGYKVDELVLIKGTTYDFGAVTVTFNFIGNTDPNAFAAVPGALDLDTFLRVRDGNVDSGLSADFNGTTTWESLFQQATFTAESAAYDITSLSLRTDTSGSFGITAVPMPAVPEPASWLMSLAGLLVIGSWVRRRVPRAD